MKQVDIIPKKESSGFGIAGFVLSLISLISFSIHFIVGLSLGILALILCIIQFKRGKTKLAIVGLILSIIAIIIGTFILIATIIVWNAVEDTVQSGTRQIEEMSENLKKGG